MDPPADVGDISDIGRDPDAFEAFYRQHLPWVRRFVARRVDDPHTAADLTADIFLAVIDSAARYDASAGTARVRYHRARTRLQDVLPSPFEVTA